MIFLQRVPTTGNNNANRKYITDANNGYQQRVPKMGESENRKMGTSYGTTKTGYGTTETGCRGGSRYVEGGFKKLTEKAIH